MAINFKKLWNGLKLVARAASAADSKGDLEVIDSTGKLQYHNGSSVSPVVTETHASQGTNRLQNKDLDASNVDIVDNSDTTKKVGASVSGATTSTKTTLTFNQTDNRAITFPDATTTVVGTDVTQTLTNKTIDADNNTISNIKNDEIAADADITRTKLAPGTADHVLINDASGEVSSEATLAKVRGGSGQDNSSLTFPASGTLATTAGTETLSNKTFSDTPLFQDGINLEDPDAGTNKIKLTAPSTLAVDYTLTLPVNDGDAGQVLSTDGSGNTSWVSAATDPMTTIGDLIYRNGSNVTARLPIGSEGEVLTVSSGVPAWAVNADGGLASQSPGSTKTTDYTIVSGDNGGVILCDTSGGAINITLPAPSAGFTVVVKDLTGSANTNSINILRNGSEKIDNAQGNDEINTAYTAHGYISNGTDWFRITSFAGDPISSNRALFAGGTTGSNSNVIDYVQMAATSNATDFGDLTVARLSISGASSATRGVFGGGDAGGNSNVIDYVTISTTGNATDFGDLTSARIGVGALSNDTRAVFAGGESGGVLVATIDYITIASTGNATSFGSLTQSRIGSAGLSSTTRGIYGGGFAGPGAGTAPTNTIDYITIASTGNATDFGDLTEARYYLGASSSSTRGIFGGGYTTNDVNTIDYITIASTGNATDFGDLTVSRYGVAGTSDKIQGLFAGGANAGVVNTIDYVTITTTANATDFGDLTVSRRNLAACSNAHGGLA